MPWPETDVCTRAGAATAALKDGGGDYEATLLIWSYEPDTHFRTGPARCVA